MMSDSVTATRKKNHPMAKSPILEVSTVALLHRQIGDAFSSLFEMPTSELAPFAVERPRELEHGDFSTNIAMVHAKKLRQSPREIAQQLAKVLANNPLLTGLDVAGPGFLNMQLSADGWQTSYQLLAERADQGFLFVAQQEKVMVEFVSANPTGPLHVGHGRGAAVGDSLVRLLRRVGYQVDAEYYVNDAGLQIELLGKSVIARARQKDDPDFLFPEDGYKGAYITDLAEAWIVAKQPGSEDERAVGRWAGEEIRKGIADDLASFRVSFDCWFSEYSLFEDGKVEQAIERLKSCGETYEHEGALWFRSSERGDEKDRVLVRSNGAKTYFASDIAYHLNKLERGYDRIVDLWGADHHGYIPRVRAALTALGVPEEKLEVGLIQFVSLVRDGSPVQMSTRGGTFETLGDLVSEVGADAARYFYLLRKPDSHLEFDLELARKQSNDNPVFYVMYAHARICALLAKGAEFAGTEPESTGALERAEQNLMLFLDSYESMLEEAARSLSPHLVVNWLQILAAAFHKFYTDCPIMQSEPALRARRLRLISWCRVVLADGLNLVGVVAPERM